MNVSRAVGLHVAWAYAMGAVALVWGTLAGDFSGGAWVWAMSIGIPLLILGTLVASPLNLMWAAALTIASRHSAAAGGGVLVLGTVLWFGIGWLYLGRGEVPRAWEAGTGTGIGGFLFGLAFAGRRGGTPRSTQAHVTLPNAE
jgi:hypothetical protein